MTLDRPGCEFEFGDAERTMRAYFSAPDAGFGPGALVLGDSNVSRDHLRDVCDRLSRAGFAALAPEQGDAAGDAGLEDAIHAILSCDAVSGRRVAAVGFGVGDARARRLAEQSPRIGAVVHFSSDSADPNSDAAETVVPHLRFVAADESTSPHMEDVPPRNGARSLTRVVPDVRPEYMDATRPDVHDAAAASESWSVLVAFLRAELA